MKIRLNGKDYEVSAKFKKEVYGFPFDEKDRMYHNEFTVCVKDNKRRVSFPFFGSNNDWEKGIKDLDKDSLRHAFYCLLSEALDARESFEDFCSNLGYDTDSRRAEQIYRACKKQENKVKKLGFANIDDLIEAVNKLND